MNGGAEPDRSQDLAVCALVDRSRVAFKQRQLGQRVLLVADVETFSIEKPILPAR